MVNAKKRLDCGCSPKDTLIVSGMDSYPILASKSLRGNLRMAASDVQPERSTAESENVSPTPSDLHAGRYRFDVPETALPSAGTSLWSPWQRTSTWVLPVVPHNRPELRRSEERRV